MSKTPFEVPAENVPAKKENEKAAPAQRDLDKQSPSKNKDRGEV